MNCLEAKKSVPGPRRIDEFLSAQHMKHRSYLSWGLPGSPRGQTELVPGVRPRVPRGQTEFPRVRPRVPRGQTEFPRGQTGVPPGSEFPRGQTELGVPPGSDRRSSPGVRPS